MDRGSLYAGTRIQEFFGAIAARYDLANHLLSGGCDFLWRRRTAALAAAGRPGVILDLATGSGDLARELGKACPGSVVVAADFCVPMLQRAQAKGVPNLVAADALRLPFAAECFDLVTIGFGLRNMESWVAALREVARVLRPGGQLLVLDFSLPRPPLREVYRLYLHRVLPAVAALVTGQRGVYQYLADSIERFPSGEAMAALLAEAGLESRGEIPMQGGIVTLQVAGRR